jgi:hypothetical protein
MVSATERMASDRVAGVLVGRLQLMDPLEMETKEATPELEYVRVSQATREMAKPATHEVRTFAQEYDELVKRKKELERELTMCGDAESKSEQRRIRANGSNKYTFAEWMKTKADLHARRKRLITEKERVEARMLTIRQKARDEKSAAAQERSRMAGATDDRLAPLLKQIIYELQQIKSVLQSR